MIEFLDPAQYGIIDATTSRSIRSGPTSGLFRIDRSAHPNVLPWKDTFGTLLDLN